MLHLRSMGMRFAPLNISLHRSVQTLGVLVHITNFMILPFVSLFLPIYMLCYTPYWWLVALYGIYFLYDFDTPSTGSRPSTWIRNCFIWREMAEYFPLKLIKTAELSPEHNYIFGSHPHGIMCWGSFTAMATEGAGFGKIFPGITPSLATLDINFWLPLRRDLGLAFGCITASKESIAYQLTRDKGGRAVMIVLGGTEEALEAQEHNYSLILKRRKGFVRLALENGAHLVPTYSFGENSLYTQIVHKQGTWVRTLQTKMKEITGFAIPHFNGRRIFNYSFGVLPYRKPINIVFGAPIPVQKVANPTEEQVQEVHDKYCEALMKLFDDHKANYGICEATKIDIL